MAVLIELVIPGVVCFVVGYGLAFFRYRWGREVLSVAEHEAVVARRADSRSESRAVVDLVGAPDPASTGPSVEVAPAVLNLADRVSSAAPAEGGTDRSSVNDPLTRRVSKARRMAAVGSDTGDLGIEVGDSGLPAEAGFVASQRSVAAEESFVLPKPLQESGPAVPPPIESSPTTPVSSSDDLANLLRDAARRPAGSERKDRQVDIDEAKAFLDRLRQRQG